MEFGSYWNACNKHNESPADRKHLGSRLFDDFDENEWDLFYVFMCETIRRYLENGLVRPTISKQGIKAIRRSVEGEHDLRFVEWFSEWLDSNDYKKQLKDKNGIALQSLYQSYEKASGNPGKIDSSKCGGMIWEYCRATGAVTYNAHKKGDTRSSRRWLLGPAGKQKEHLKLIKV